MKKRGAWGTRFGFYLAAVGSAFGLGSLWRFPYVVTENGGGAFVILYVALVFLVGLPLIIGELILGKHSRRAVLSALGEVLKNRKSGVHSSLQNISQEHLTANFSPTTEIETLQSKQEKFALLTFSFVGRMALLICLVVLAYYAVICGWVLHFFGQFTISWITESQTDAAAIMENLKSSAWLQVLLTTTHLGIIVLIVTKGVENGIEKAVGLMTPAFLVIMVLLVYKAMTGLPTTSEALRYLLYPDFSKLRWDSLGHALGHVLFTLSIGFGTMITFGSYLKERAYIPMASFRVATVDSVISVLAGLFIFPVVLAVSYTSSGPELLFRTVPYFLNSLSHGQIYGMGFFLCLYLAALGASLGLLETIVASLNDAFKIKRTAAAGWTGLVLFLVALIPSLSSTTFGDWTIQGRGVLEWIDHVLINWLLPLVALFFSQVIVYVLDDKIKEEQFLNETTQGSKLLYGHWKFFLKWVIPPVIILSLGLQWYQASLDGYQNSVP